MRTYARRKDTHLDVGTVSKEQRSFKIEITQQNKKIKIVKELVENSDHGFLRLVKSN